MIKRKNITEGLDYHDLQGQIEPSVAIDKYVAKTGTDDEIIVLSFVVDGKEASVDLADWFEKGYDFVVDASVSEGELSPGKFVVFVEIKRRTYFPEKLQELLKDLFTITDIKMKDWNIVIDDNEYEFDTEIIQEKVTLSPKQYKLEVDREEELNEFREIAGLQSKNIYSSNNKDSLLMDYLNKAGM